MFSRLAQQKKCEILERHLLINHVHMMICRLGATADRPLCASYKVNIPRLCRGMFTLSR